MARWTIHYACGHDSSEYLYGPIAERNRRAAQLGRSVCPKCYAQQHAGDAPEVYIRQMPVTANHPDPRVELIALGNTYPYRDELRERGWQFGRYNGRSIMEVLAYIRHAPGIARRAMEGRAGWSIVCTSAQFDRELAWLGAVKGWSILERKSDSDPWHLLASAVIEGRRELVP